MSAKTKAKGDSAKLRQAIKDAERVAADAKAAHRAAFRAACAALFNEWGFFLMADGDLSAHLRIEEMREGHKYPLEELPE